jgi:hypothetical protein
LSDTDTLEHTPLTDDMNSNYHLFFNDAANTGCVWGLQDDEGWAQCGSEKYAETTVIPFWSQPEYAEIHRKDDWAGYHVVAISLEEFLDDWLTGMHEDVLLVGINWNDDLEGEDHEPLDILHEFEQALI